MTPAKDAPTCNDCYFRRHGLCAMSPERVCPTFRAATLTLRPSVPAETPAGRGRRLRLESGRTMSGAQPSLEPPEQPRKSGRTRGSLATVRLIVAALVALYAIAFIALNTHSTKVDLVFGSTNVSVIWVILLSTGDRRHARRAGAAATPSSSAQELTRAARRRPRSRRSTRSCTRGGATTRRRRSRFP